MSMRPGSRRAPGSIRRFEVWFGGIFLTVGLVVLLVAAVLVLIISDNPGPDSTIWAVLVAPLSVGGVFTVLGAVFVRRGLRLARREERLLQVGTTTEATVTSVEPTYTRVNRRRLWRVRYTYEDLYGTLRDGDSGYLSAEEAQRYHVGDPIFVRYDPERPSESIWLGREDVASG